MFTESLAAFLKETGCDQKKYLTSQQWRKLALKFFDQFEELFEWEQSIVAIAPGGKVAVSVPDEDVNTYPFLQLCVLPEDVQLVALLETVDLSSRFTAKFAFESDEDCNSFSGKVLRITVVTRNGDALVAEREISTGRHRFSNFAIGIEPALLAVRLNVELRLNQKRLAFGMLTVPSVKSDPFYKKELKISRKFILWLLEHPTLADLLPAYYEDRADSFVRHVSGMPGVYGSNAAAAVMLSALPYLGESEIFEEIKLSTGSAKKAQAVMDLINRTFN